MGRGRAVRRADDDIHVILRMHPVNDAEAEEEEEGGDEEVGHGRAESIAQFGKYAGQDRFPDLLK